MKFFKESIVDLSTYKLASHKVRDHLVDQDQWIMVWKMDWNEAVFNNADLKKYLIDRIKVLPLNYYPNTNNIKLLDKLAEYSSTSQDSILYYNWSDDALDNICELFDFRKTLVWTINPSYDNFRIYVEKRWWTIQYYELTNWNKSVNVSEIIDFIHDRKVSLFYLISPHNPLWFSLSKDEIERLITECPNCFFVIDQAYIEFSTRKKFQYEDLLSSQNVIFVRTFSKALWIAWLRLWYVIANSKVIEILSLFRNPKSISMLAQEAGLYILNHLEPILDYIYEVKQWKNKLYDYFDSLNIKYFVSDANFVLFYIWWGNKRELQDFLESRNLYIRFLTNPLLNDYVRVSIWSSNFVDIFIKALDDFIKKKWVKFW